MRSNLLICKLVVLGMLSLLGVGCAIDEAMSDLTEEQLEAPDSSPTKTGDGAAVLGCVATNENADQFYPPEWLYHTKVLTASKGCGHISAYHTSLYCVSARVRYFRSDGAIFTSNWGSVCYSNPYYFSVDVKEDTRFWIETASSGKQFKVEY